MEELHQNNTRGPEHAHIIMATPCAVGSVFYFSYFSYGERAKEASSGGKERGGRRGGEEEGKGRRRAGRERQAKQR